MTDVLFLSSVQAHQVDRVRTIVEKLRKRVPDVNVRIAELEESKELLAKNKIQFGPAVLIDGRLEYVGIPRLSMLVDRLFQVKEGRSNPRTAGEKPGTGPARPAAPPTAPAASSQK